MKQLIAPEEAIELLSKAGCSSSIVQHCKTVSKLAVKYARDIKKRGTEIDVPLVRIGGLLHDIGRSKTHQIDHAVVGVEIARSFDLPEPVIRIIERHIGSGIPAEEAATLGLPHKSYIPETLEEKVVSYADKLIEGSHEITFDEALERFTQEFGRFNPIVVRFKQIHDELILMLGRKLQPC